MELKLNTILIYGFIIIILISIVYALINQDCDKNPPQVLSCSSNNLIDNGYSDCKLIQQAEKNLIFPDKIAKYNCEYNGTRIQTQLERTKCTYSTSNLTTDYRFCS